MGGQEHWRGHRSGRVSSSTHSPASVGSMTGDFFSNIRKSKSREADSGRTGQAFGETSHHTQKHSEMTFFQTPLQ